MVDEHSHFMVFYSNKHGHTWYNPKRLGAPQVRILGKWGRTWEFRAASFLNKAACFWNCPRNRPGRYRLYIYNYVYICIYDPNGLFEGSMQWPIICDVWCPQGSCDPFEFLSFQVLGSRDLYSSHLYIRCFLTAVTAQDWEKRLILDLSWFISSGYNKCRFNKFQYTYDMW